MLTVFPGSSLFSFVALCKNCSGQRAIASCGAKLFQLHRCLVAASDSGPHSRVFSMRQGGFLVRESVSIIKYVELWLCCCTACCCTGSASNGSLVHTAGDDTNSDWLKLKEQLCTCGDANVAVFLSNRRRSNAVMHLSLATLALLRPLRTAFDSSTLVCKRNVLCVLSLWL